MGVKRKPSSTTPSNLQPESQKPKLDEEKFEPVSEPESEPAPSSSEEEDSEEDEPTKRENIRKLLEPFSKDQLINLLQDAAIKNPSILSGVKALANTDPTHRKIFVHGLGFDATTEQVLNTFKPYGEIEECKLITDKVTGRAKGYGFVLFKTRAGAKKALKEPQKKIGNRNTSCQLAVVGPVVGNSESSGSGRKIFIGNVGPNVSIEKLKGFFEKYGEIEEGPLGFDSVTKKFKGFAILVYKTVEGFNRALEEPAKVLDGCQLQCKKFVENLNKNNSNASTSNGNQVVQQQKDMGYGFGMTPGIFAGANLMNPTPLLLGQGMGFGMNPVLGLNPYGLVNSVSPSVIGSYGSQPALQGLGTYPGAQMGQPSIGGTAAMKTITPPARDSTGVGPSGATYSSYSSYLGR